MSRSFSATMRAALFAEETGEVIVALMTVAHPDLATPMRFSSDPTTRLSTEPLRYGTTSRGEQFDYVPFTVLLPEDTEEKAPEIRIGLDNVDRATIQLLRSTSTPADVTIELVLASNPDAVEVSYPDFDLSAAEYDAGVATLTLTINALATEPFPAGTFTPSGFPGLF